MARVLVVGAGMAGLVGAGVLHRAGHDVVVVDKGRNPGGRAASREVDGAVWDHGAQFVTLRDDAIAEETTRWRERGWLVEWFRGSPDLGAGSHAPPASDGDGHPRYRGAPYQRGLPEALAAELPDVRTSVTLGALASDGHGWRAAGRTYAGEDVDLGGDALLVTPPAPQSLRLLDAGGVVLPEDVRAALEAVAFDPCLALLGVPEDADATLPDPGAARLVGHPVLDFVADNRAKGVSPAPSWTVHGTAAFTREWLDADRDAAGEALADAVEDRFGVRLRPVHVQGWRYSSPTSSSDDPAPGGTQPGPIRFAGDAFTGGRLEGAARSGHEAARRLLVDLA